MSDARAPAASSSARSPVPARSRSAAKSFTTTRTRPSVLGAVYGFERGNRGYETGIGEAPAFSPRVCRHVRYQGGARIGVPAPLHLYDGRVASTDSRETDSGIEVKPVYTADDVEGELELPGEYPFTRGPYPDMYRGRPW